MTTCLDFSATLPGVGCTDGGQAGPFTLPQETSVTIEWSDPGIMWTIYDEAGDVVVWYGNGAYGVGSGPAISLTSQFLNVSLPAGSYAAAFVDCYTSGSHPYTFTITGDCEPGAPPPSDNTVPILLIGLGASALITGLIVSQKHR